MEKLNRTESEKKVLKMLIDADLTQKDVAKHMDVTPQAINNRMKRGSIEPVVEAINELSS